jgi:hypothetical protein
VSEEE